MAEKYFVLYMSYLFNSLHIVALRDFKVLLVQMISILSLCYFCKTISFLFFFF